MTAQLPEDFDWHEPRYAPVFQERARRLYQIRSRPELLPGLKRYYRDQPAQFIIDWGTTFDPRVVKRGQPALMPFLLFPKQIEWVDWLMARWSNDEPGVTDKSRDLGLSWLAVATMVTLSVFYDGFTAGFGSRKEEYVDRIGSPKSLFWKARQFIRFLPEEFRGGHVAGKHDPSLRLSFPDTGSTISGEAGDNIGRGDRASIYVVDEAAYLERPQLIEASLSATTDCRIDISSANGMTNPFAVKRFSYPSAQIFTLHWRDDPRKDDEWYARQCANLDPVTVAQEIDINYAASVTGVVISSEWVQSSVDAHVKLGIAPVGEHRGALDVADEGTDKNAFAACHGILVDFLEEWSGKGSDLFYTTKEAFRLCADLGLSEFLYDADGMGASVRGDARVLNEARHEAGLISGRIPKPVRATAWRGSGEILFPDRQDFEGRTNADYFKNAKAQSWGWMQKRFKETHRAIHEPGYQYNPTMIISLSSKLPGLTKLCAELSQPTWGPNNVGQMVVDKAPDGTRSPNLADAVMILMGRHKRAMRISDEAMRAA